jgi:hypothetical protein
LIWQLRFLFMMDLISQKMVKEESCRGVSPTISNAALRRAAENLFCHKISMFHPLNALRLDDAAETWSWQAKNIFLTQQAQASLMYTVGLGIEWYSGVSPMISNAALRRAAGNIFCHKISMFHPLNALRLDDAAETWGWQAKNIFLTQQAQASLMYIVGLGIEWYSGVSPTISNAARWQTKKICHTLCAADRSC